MTTEHPITPPPELVDQWSSAALGWPGGYDLEMIATEAARWGSDQELEASCEWLATTAMTKPWETVAQLARKLRSARRPKPPSLKEQALAELEILSDYAHGLGCSESAIRRALEQLDD